MAAEKNVQIPASVFFTFYFLLQQIEKTNFMDQCDERMKRRIEEAAVSVDKKIAQMQARQSYTSMVRAQNEEEKENALDWYVFYKNGNKLF